MALRESNSPSSLDQKIVARKGTLGMLIPEFIRDRLSGKFEYTISIKEYT